MDKKLYTVMVEVCGVVLAESEKEAAKFYKKILENEFVSEDNADVIESNGLPYGWSEDDCVYHSDKSKDITVKEAREMIKNG